MDFKIQDGALVAKDTFTNPDEKRRLQKELEHVSKRWQFEILGIVAELMNYKITISQKGDEMTLEAERNGETHPCDSIKVTQKGDDATLVFEHFKSRGKLDVETAKFLTLAHKLGVKIAMKWREVQEGDPFPEEERLTHEHRHGHGHSHKK